MGKSTLYLAGAFALGVSAKHFVALPAATTTFDFNLEALLDIPVPTRAPVIKAVDRRQTSRNTATSILVAPDNICGYIDGRSGAPFSCLNDDFTCMFFTADATRYGNVACCNPTTCGVRVACIDYDEFHTSSLCDSGCRLDAYTLKCTDTAQPYCNTISFTSDILDYWCNAFEDTSTQVAVTTYPGQTGREWATITLNSDDEEDDDDNTAFDDLISNIESEETTSSSSTATSSDEATTTDGDNDSESAGAGEGDGDDDNDDGGSSTPIGPIVGGVVGGVAVIAAVAFGIWFILRRKKKEAAAANGGNPPMQQAQGVPPQGPQGPYSPGNMAPMGAMGAMAPGQSPPPHQSYYDPSKGGYMQQDFQPTPPPGYQQPHQQYQQQHLAPGPHYAASTIPDRADTTSPSALSQSNASMHRLSAVSPGTPGSQNQQQFGGYAPGAPQQPGQPTIYEAPGSNDGHHRGQMHEMA